MGEERALLEAILFMEREPIERRRLAAFAGLSTEQLDTLLAELRTDLAREERGLDLVTLAGAVALTPKRSLWPRLRDRYGTEREARLSRAALETLSIVAYSQPITRAEIEALRGVSADAMIRQLQERELIREVGRKEAPGRPIEFGTTDEFLRRFGLESIADLPKLDERDEQRFSLNG